MEEERPDEMEVAKKKNEKREEKEKCCLRKALNIRHLWMIKRGDRKQMISSSKKL